MTILCSLFGHWWIHYSTWTPSAHVPRPDHVPFSLRYCLRKCGGHQLMLFQNWGDIPTYGQESKDFVAAGLTA